VITRSSGIIGGRFEQGSLFGAAPIPAGGLDVRYRLDIIGPNVLDAVKSAGGWMYDRVVAGWDVTAIITGEQDSRPLRILGAQQDNLESVLSSASERARRHTVAIAVSLFDSDVGQAAIRAFGRHASELIFWGDRTSGEPREEIYAMREHRLSPAACAFKARALAAVDDAGSDMVRPIELFHCGPMALDNADLIPTDDRPYANSRIRLQQNHIQAFNGKKQS
jgi:hypothetical protein